MHLNAHYRGRDERSFAPSGPVSTKSFYSYFYVDYKAFFFIQFFIFAKYGPWHQRRTFLLWSPVCKINCLKALVIITLSKAVDQNSFVATCPSEFCGGSEIVGMENCRFLVFTHFRTFFSQIDSQTVKKEVTAELVFDSP